MRVEDSLQGWLAQRRKLIEAPLEQLKQLVQLPLKRRLNRQAFSVCSLTKHILTSTLLFHLGCRKQVLLSAQVAIPRCPFRHCYASLPGLASSQKLPHVIALKCLQLCMVLIQVHKKLCEASFTCHGASAGSGKPRRANCFSS